MEQSTTHGFVLLSLLVTVSNNLPGASSGGPANQHHRHQHQHQQQQQQLARKVSTSSRLVHIFERKVSNIRE